MGFVKAKKSFRPATENQKTYLSGFNVIPEDFDDAQKKIKKIINDHSFYPEKYYMESSFSDDDAEYGDWGLDASWFH
jgi:predicted butyrate kinase (DUF1464 family)